MNMRIRFDGSHFDALNCTVADVLNVLNVRTRVRGGPDWVQSLRFDIVARVGVSVPVKISDVDQHAMVLALLEDCFRLVSHVEAKEVSGLALVAGKELPRLVPAGADEVTRSIPGEGGKIVFQKISMRGLANVLTTRLGVPVSDRTGIAGQFDFSIDPDKYLAEPGLQQRYVDRIRAAVEALGLRFETEKARTEAVVIDKVEKPGEN
jgi:uncharacterized protein (TIGR03435 family)